MEKMIGSRNFFSKIPWEIWDFIFFGLNKWLWTLNPQCERKNCIHSCQSKDDGLNCPSITIGCMCARLLMCFSVNSYELTASKYVYNGSCLYIHIIHLQNGLHLLLVAYVQLFHKLLATSFVLCIYKSHVLQASQK